MLSRLISAEIHLGRSSPVNLNSAGNFFASSNTATLASTVYAFGRVDLPLFNSNGHARVVNNVATDYDWNTEGGIVRSTLIYERWRTGGLNPGTPKIPWYLFPTPQDKSFLTPIPNVRFGRIVENNPGGTLIILSQPTQERTPTITIGTLSPPTVLPDKKPNP